MHNYKDKKTSGKHRVLNIHSVLVQICLRFTVLLCECLYSKEINHYTIVGSVDVALGDMFKKSISGCKRPSILGFGEILEGIHHFSARTCPLSQVEEQNMVVLVRETAKSGI